MNFDIELRKSALANLRDVEDVDVEAYTVIGAYIKMLENQVAFMEDKVEGMQRAASMLERAHKRSMRRRG